MKRFLLMLVAVAVVFASANAMAATVTNNLTSQAVVVGTCSISSVTSLDFGNYDPVSTTADDDGVGGVSFRCTRGVAYDVYITGTRSMTIGESGTGDALAFEMYQESGRTNVWPSAGPGVTGTAANNATITKDIYGRIAAEQDVSAGSYLKTVVVTVAY